MATAARRRKPTRTKDDQRAAHELREMLAARHAVDVFVPECKTGATDSGLLKLDAWAMKKSWADPLTWGYEIKVSRGDFTGDQKWHNYLRYCSEFYFVAPLGLIETSELPPEAGLMVCAKTGSRLLMKKKAQRRQVVVPEDLFRYVLMWRATGIGGEHQGSASDEAEFWRGWMKQRDEDKELGHHVSRKVAKLVRERITSVQCDQKALEKRLEKYAEIESMLNRLGFTTNWIPDPYLVEKRLQAMGEIIPAGFIGSLLQLSNQAQQIVKSVQDQKAVIAGSAG